MLMRVLAGAGGVFVRLLQVGGFGFGSESYNITHHGVVAVQASCLGIRSIVRVIYRGRQGLPVETRFTLLRNYFCWIFFGQKLFCF